MVTKSGLTKKRSSSKHHAGRELLALIKRHVKEIPQSELDKLPTDGASNHDHYLYGTPKRK